MTSPIIGKHAISAPALYAARGLLMNYKMETVPGTPMSRFPVSEYNVALVVDLCTAVYRLAPIMPKARYWYDQLKRGRARPEDLEDFLRELLTALQYLPAYAGGALVMQS